MDNQQLFNVIVAVAGFLAVYVINTMTRAIQKLEDKVNEIPKGYVGLVFPRSSIRKTDLSLTNCVGVIDSGYRGEIQATFKKIFGKNDVRLDELDYNVGDRIAQIMIIPYPSVTFVEVDELSQTDRGEGGFGSTGS